jgi:glycosyltransferase involved in cell wall biosynthesis
MFHANLAARLARLLCPAPVVISTLHSATESPRGSAEIRARDRLYRLTDRLADVTVAVSEAVAERHAAAGAVARHKLRVIPNGVDTERFRPDPLLRERMRRELGLGGEFVWLAVGRLMWKKGYPAMLEAFGRQGGGVLLVAGAGPLEEQLRQQAAAFGGRVRFLGERRDIAELMAAADACVQASLVEGLPMALLEAAAAGLPTVATDVGGTAEIVASQVTGFLAPAGDAVALAEAMARMEALSPAERRKMGEAARARVLERFDSRLALARWEDLYGELAARWT